MEVTRLLSRTTTATSRASSSARCLRQHHRNYSHRSLSLISSPTSQLPILYNSRPTLHRPQQQQQRSFSLSHHRAKGLQPDSADPSPPQTEPNASGSSHSPAAAQLSESEYHEIADEYLDRLVYAAEELSESSESGIDVEYSAGVLTIIHPMQGSYVVNKQPPNKQIWLSSPVSGPKRYDWVVAGDAGQHEKEGSVMADDAEAAGDDGAGGRWVYLRDGSSLSELLRREIGVVISTDRGEGGDT
ncbi:uncharacterized protein A1O9_12400 [Exophiala aquamarina CBS 119918]|uniref:ferroxidase n=1 Tax=Exophiala aquamarina CBS 119918 TaxID=1182545 RepID=A0A072NWQ8_9EURO|nr:uncharacterized protein A1O9_12400 [Exophiala aquamarina CBS 119918]KEF51483.1 hypothetical protein A1O9_12400 [Exophiala aquamarina CBS 119918]